MSQSISLPCPRCGAALPVDPTRADVACAYCRVVVPVPPHFRERAMAHAAKVGAARGKLAEGQSALRMYEVSAKARKHTWKILVGFFGIFGCFYLVLFALGPGAAESAARILPFAIYGFMGLVGILYYRAYRRTKRADGGPLAVTTGVCPRCGAALAFEAGSAAAVCRACDATALAGAEIQASLAQAAEARVRSTDVERARAERNMYRSMSGMRTFTRVYLAVALSFPIVGLIAVALIGGALTLHSGLTKGVEHDVRAGAVLLGVAAVTLSIAMLVGVVVYKLRFAPARAIDRALRAFASRTRGQISQGSNLAALDWLDACWQGPAPFEVMLAQQDFRRWTLSVIVDGAPALMVVSTGGQFTGKRVQVLVAWPKPRAEGAPAARAAHDLQRDGFELKGSYDGVVLSRATVHAREVSEAWLEAVLRSGAAVAKV